MNEWMNYNKINHTIPDPEERFPKLLLHHQTFLLRWVQRRTLRHTDRVEMRVRKMRRKAWKSRKKWRKGTTHDRHVDNCTAEEPNEQKKWWKINELDVRKSRGMKQMKRIRKKEEKRKEKRSESLSLIVLLFSASSLLIDYLIVCFESWQTSAMEIRRKKIWMFAFQIFYSKKSCF